MMNALRRTWHHFWFVWHGRRVREYRDLMVVHEYDQGRHIAAVHNMGLANPFNRALLEVMKRHS
jgi:hypothetical protein